MTDTDTDFIEREFPSRIANLGFFVPLPSSWQAQDLPEEEPAFDDPTRLFGLGAAAAPYAAIVLAAAARPAFDNGTVLDWSRFLIERNGVSINTMGPATLGELPAIIGQCNADSDMGPTGTTGPFGPMCTHFAFAEDGGRLIYLSVTGPQALSSHLWQVWQQILRGFRLASPQGPTVAVMPAAPEAAPVDDSGENAASPPAADPDAHALAAADVGSFALEGGAATIRQDHPINQRLLEMGKGFAPNIRALDEANGRAWVASIALQAVLAIPLGWHPLDDGRRLLLMHPDSSVQISLERLSAPGGDLDALLDRIEASAREEQDGLRTQRMASGPIAALALVGFMDGDTPLAQLHLVMHSETEGVALRARATATRERSKMAGDLAEALLMGIQFGMEIESTGQPGEAELPEWAQQARALEAQGRMEEAEQAMREGCPQLGVLISIAEMYRRRMQRLAGAGDPAGAAAARERAIHFAQQYASGATSGGEGAALSRERDRFIEELGHK